MKSLRARITVTLSVLVAAACGLALGASALVRAWRFAEEMPSVRVLTLGVALRDVALTAGLAAAILLAVLVVTWSTTKPILTLTRAAQEIARGNFDVQVQLSRQATEFLELESAFNAMAAELRQNENLRRDFIANASHEMKTPLTVIQGYARLLEEETLPPDQRRQYAGLIAREAERLSHMTGNLLRLGRLESQGLPPGQEEFDLAEQLRGAIGLLRPRWSSRDLEVTAELPPVTIRGDRELLGQVWQNLLENAVKFAPPEGRVGLRLRPERDRVLVTVTDDGPGMGAETRRRCFEPFYQGEASHQGEGSGLGLALVRRIVELHGGTVRIESAPGEGTAVTVDLPAGR